MLPSDPVHRRRRRICCGCKIKSTWMFYLLFFFWFIHAGNTHIVLVYIICHNQTPLKAVFRGLLTKIKVFIGILSVEHNSVGRNRCLPPHHCFLPSDHPWSVALLVMRHDWANMKIISISNDFYFIYETYKSNFNNLLKHARLRLALKNAALIASFVSK